MSKKFTSGYGWGVYIGKAMNVKKTLMLGLCMSLLTVIVFYLVKQVYTWTGKGVGSFNYGSFSFLNLYNLLFFVGMGIFLIIGHSFLTFGEVRKNKWYVLMQFGFAPNKLIFAKLFAKTVSMIFAYLLGFAVSIFFCVLLDFLVLSFIFPIIIVGMINIIVLIVLALSLSLLCKDDKMARFSIVGTAALMFLLQIFAGFFKLINDASAMSQVVQLFSLEKSWYLLCAAGLFFLGLIICIVKGNRLAVYYAKTKEEEEYGKLEILPQKKQK